MKTPNIQNVFKMMIGTSALIASTAFFINTISPVQASENKISNSQSINSSVVADEYKYYLGCGSSIYGGNPDYWGKVTWRKVGP
jgi:hypothetical protein